MTSNSSHNHVNSPGVIRQASPDVTNWRSIALYVAVGATAAAQIGKGLVALPALQQDFTLTAVQLAWIVSALNIVGAVLALPLAICSIWLGQRRMVIVALGTIAVASVIGLGAHGPAILIASRCLEGLGVTVILAVLPGLLARATASHQLRQLLAFWPAVMPIVVAVMLVSTPWAIERYGWRPIWGATAVTAIVCLGLMLYNGHYHDPAAQTRQGTRLRDLSHSMQIGQSLRGKSIWLLAVILACYSAQFLAAVTLLPIALQEYRAVSEVVSGIIIGGAFMANAAGCVLGALAERRRCLSTSLVVIGSSVTMAVSSWVAYQPTMAVTSRAIALIVLALAGGLIAAVAMAALPAAVRTPTLTVGAALLVQGINLGQLVGPPAMAGVAIIATGWQQEALAMTVMASVSASAGVALRFTMKK